MKKVIWKTKRNFSGYKCFFVILVIILSVSFKPVEKSYVMTEQEFYSGYLKQPSLVKAVYSATDFYGGEPVLMLALCRMESRCDPKALGVNQNKTQDKGLFQLNSSMYDIDAVWDPTINTFLGVRHLTMEINRLGNWQDALRSYRSGSIRRNNPETEKYVSVIMLDYFNLVQQYKYYKEGVKNGL
jgi:hypothetical protein